MWKWILKHSQWTRNNRGGGPEEQTTEVVPRPVQPPSASDIAKEQYGIYQQYAPQQLGLGEQRAGLISQQLASPQYLTPEQQAAQESIRGRETGRLQEAMRTRANLGGGLYGGRAAGAEERAVSQMGQGYAQQDISNQQNMLLSLLGLGGGISPGQIAPGAGTQYGGQLQAALASQPEYYHQFAQPSPWWGVAGEVGGQAAGAATAKLMTATCLAEDTEITVKKKIKDIEIGDYVLTNDGFKKVKKTFKYDKSPTMKLNDLECTEFHPIVTPEGLKFSGQFKEKKLIKSNKKVHNLEVEGHKFYANGVLVHDGREVSYGKSNMGTTR